MENFVSRKKKEIILGLAFIIFLIILITFIIQENISLTDFENYVLSFGKWTPLALLIIIVITSSIGFVFTIPVAVSALVLGIYGAFFISLLGLTLGAAISFFICRSIGREYVERKFIKKRKRLEEYDEHLEKRGFLTILFLRFISLIPYELINITGGLSKVKFSHFIAGTFLGIIPGTLITIWFVRSIKDIHSLQFILASALYALFSLLPIISKRVRRIVSNAE